jgi:hypothetical protein
MTMERFVAAASLPRIRALGADVATPSPIPVFHPLDSVLLDVSIACEGIVLVPILRMLPRLKRMIAEITTTGVVASSPPCTLSDFLTLSVDCTSWVRADCNADVTNLFSSIRAPALRHVFLSRKEAPPAPLDHVVKASVDVADNAAPLSTEAISDLVCKFVTAPNTYSL